MIKIITHTVIALGLVTLLTAIPAQAQNNNTAATLVPVISLLLGDEDECTAGTTVIGDQILAEQADVNALRNVSIIEGDLTLSPNTELDFSPLNNLAEVTGSFSLENSNVQTNLMGFNCLTQVGVNLNIRDNAALVSLSGFDKLNRAGNHLRISGNSNLTSLPTFPELTQIIGALEIEDNARLVSFSGFDKLTTIGRDIDIQDNTELVSFSGFDKLTTIDEDLEIERNSSLTSLPTFPELTEVDNNLEIVQNSKLVSFSGFDKLTTVGFSLFVGSNSNLTSLPTFPELTTVGNDLSISDNDGLVSFSGFDKLTTIGLDLDIQNNSSLTGLPAFLVDVISESIKLNNNLLSDITSIQALAHRNLTSPGLDFNIGFNCLSTTKVPTRGILAGIDNNSGTENVLIDNNPRLSRCPSPLPAQADSVSEFDLDASLFDESEGWTITGNDTSTTPDHQATGGQSGGFIKDVDGPTGILWYFKAPIQYYGDASDYKDGSLSYYVKQLTGTTPFIGDDIILQGGNVTLTHRFDDPNPSSSEWTLYTVPLSASAWNVGINSTNTATDADMNTVLGDLNSLEIRGEYISGPDSAGLDSVVMKKP